MGFHIYMVILSTDVRWQSGRALEFQQNLDVPRPSEIIDSGELELPLAPSAGALMCHPAPGPGVGP
jgi:hypothetical protein